MGLGLRVAWIRRDAETGLVCRTSRCGLKFASWNLNKLASIDVVPVNPDTVDEWEYPPYSGYYDGMSSLERSDLILMMCSRKEYLGTWQLRRQEWTNRSAVGFTLQDTRYRF